MVVHTWSLYTITLGSFSFCIFKKLIINTMSTTKKIWLGIFTFLPFLLGLVYIVYFFTFFLETIINAENNQNEFPVEFFQSLSTIIVVVILAVIIKLAIMVYYIVHVSNNKDKDSNTKIMWIVLLVLVSSIASLVYYFVEIIPSKQSDKQIGYQ